MAELKTRPTDRDVADFIAAIPDPRRRAECETVAKLMRRVVRAKPRMWGPSIVGFGEYTMTYASGRETEWMLVGFSPRKQALTVYLMGGAEAEPALLKKLGPYSTGKSCLYLKRLDDVDLDVLEELVRRSVARVETHANTTSSKRKAPVAKKTAAKKKASAKKKTVGKKTAAKKATTKKAKTAKSVTRKKTATSARSTTKKTKRRS